MMYLTWCVIRVIQRQLPAVMAWCWTLYFIVLHCCGIIQVMYLAWCVTHIILCRLPSVMAQCSTIKYYQVWRKIKYYPSGVCTWHDVWPMKYQGGCPPWWLDGGGGWLPHSALKIKMIKIIQKWRMVWRGPAYLPYSALGVWYNIKLFFNACPC